MKELRELLEYMLSKINGGAYGEDVQSAIDDLLEEIEKL